MSFMKKQIGSPCRKAARRNGSLHSDAEDVTTPASLESPFLQIQERTSYPIKNILKNSSVLLYFCVFLQMHKWFYVYKVKMFPFFRVETRFSPRSEGKALYIVLCLLLQHG